MSLIEFSVENYKLFKNKVTFSTLGRKGKHTFDNKGENLYKTSLIFGPNASGKTTLLESIRLIKNGIIKSADTQVGSKLPYHDFSFSDRENIPSFFEIIFSLDEDILKYNFSLSKDTVLTENLFKILVSGKEDPYFIRKGSHIDLFGPFSESMDIFRIKTRDDVLFLSASSQWKNNIAMKLVEAFRNLNSIQGTQTDGYRSFTRKKFKEDLDFRKKIIGFLKKADFNIVDGDVETVDISDDLVKQTAEVFNLEDIPKKADIISFLHEKFDSKGKAIGASKLKLEEESKGTQKFFDLLGPIIDTLEKGKVLFIDEFDSSLHPLLTKFILDLFENENPNNAQLIATTHDTSLISRKDYLDRAQIWFTEKDKYGVGKLFSLAEFNNLRNDTAEISQKYLEGRFGAVPFIE